jgi:signal peptidase I
MAPTMSAGEKVLVTPDSESALERGALVYASSGSVLRVIGIPQETVTGEAGQVLVNGRQVSESYVRSGTSTACSPITAVADEYVLLGDNRSAARDSRFEGAYRRADITGIVRKQT